MHKHIIVYIYSFLIINHISNKTDASKTCTIFTFEIKLLSSYSYPSVYVSRVNVLIDLEGQEKRIYIEEKIYIYLISQWSGFERIMIRFY